MNFGHTEPRVLMYALEDPLIALAAAVVLQAADECAFFPSAYGLFFSSWFSLFADALESEPQRLRTRLGVPDLPTALE